MQSLAVRIDPITYILPVCFFNNQQNMISYDTCMELIRETSCAAIPPSTLLHPPAFLAMKELLDLWVATSDSWEALQSALKPALLQLLHATLVTLTSLPRCCIQTSRTSQPSNKWAKTPYSQSPVLWSALMCILRILCMWMTWIWLKLAMN